MEASAVFGLLWQYKNIFDQGKTYMIASNKRV